MRSFIIFITLSLFLKACTLPSPYGDLRITVLDTFQNPVANAQVTLYASLDDFNTETNPLNAEASLTNSQGIASFSSLGKAGEYYVNVTKDLENNWEGNHKTNIVITENGFNNTLQISIFKNQSSDLATPNGKIWKIKEIRLANGTNVTSQANACVLDNEFTFFKGGKFEVNEKTNICAGANSNETGTWELMDEKTKVKIDLTTSSQTWAIIQIKSNLLRMEQTLLINNQAEVCEVIYE